MTAPLDWTPDGPNCRQCGRHDYLLHLHADEIHGWAGCTTDAECPLASKPVAKFEPWSPPLKWTSEQPTVPGWYWVRWAGLDEDYPAMHDRVLEVAWFDDLEDITVRALCLMDDPDVGGGTFLSEIEGALWAGPLVPPESP